MIRYLSLAAYLWLAELVTGIEAQVLARSSRVDLADSALHAAAASYDGIDFYPGVVEKAAALAWHLARNHPLPDGNKRAAWAALVMFVDLNEGRWEPDPPNVDEAERAMMAVAAGTMGVDASQAGSGAGSTSGNRFSCLPAGSCGRRR